jgi:hypothetical protein
MEFLMERDERARRERKRARAAVSAAHFTLDGRALCEHSAPAYSERLSAAGSPPCADTLAKQSRRFPALAKAFPGRVALVACDCPHNAKGARDER